MNSVPHPIPYQGSKRKLAPAILSYFPKHVRRLVEPFAGSAAISLAAAWQGKADKFWINDAHKPLMELWRRIINHPDELASRYKRLWNQQLGNDREFYDVIRERFNKTQKSEYFLYLLARCVKACIRYNSSGEFNNSPDNRRKGARPETMRSRIFRASALLRGNARITSWDFKDVLAKCDESDLIYMDPPYQGVCGDRDNRYAPTIDHEKFCRTLDQLNAKSSWYIISYDGRTDSKTYGDPMPDDLHLVHLELRAGRSTQATLLGKKSYTYESLYLSPALARAISYSNRLKDQPRQLTLAF